MIGAKMPDCRGLPIRKSPRRTGYDYGRAASYLVTIDVDYREWRFGSIEQGVVRPNAAGKLVESEWCALPTRFPGIALDAFGVMPDHVHGILCIGTEPGIQLRRQAAWCKPSSPSPRSNTARQS
jgi:hypothetical protein